VESARVKSVQASLIYRSGGGPCVEGLFTLGRELQYLAILDGNASRPFSIDHFPFITLSLEEVSFRGVSCDFVDSLLAKRRRTIHEMTRTDTKRNPRMRNGKLEMENGLFYPGVMGPLNLSGFMGGAFTIDTSPFTI